MMLDFDKKVKVDLNFGPGKIGNLTIFYLKDIPIYVSVYEWDLDYQYMTEEIIKVIGPNYKITDGGGGNGHFGYEIEII